jgi:hypothetical protein
MTFTLLCPKCGHPVGSGGHQPTEDGKESTFFHITAHSNPPQKPAEHAPHTHEGGKK